METMYELVPLAKEIWSQKSNRHMVKVYMVGTAVAFLGVVLGLVETACQPFSAQDPTDQEMIQLVLREQQALETKREKVRQEEEEEEIKTTIRLKKQPQAVGRQRNTVNRLHAS